MVIFRNWLNYDESHVGNLNTGSTWLCIKCIKTIAEKKCFNIYFNAELPPVELRFDAKKVWELFCFFDNRERIAPMLFKNLFVRISCNSTRHRSSFVSSHAMWIQNVIENIFLDSLTFTRNALMAVQTYIARKARNVTDWWILKFLLFIRTTRHTHVRPETVSKARLQHWARWHSICSM